MAPAVGVELDAEAASRSSSKSLFADTLGSHVGSAPSAVGFVKLQREFALAMDRQSRCEKIVSNGFDEDEGACVEVGVVVAVSVAVDADAGAGVDNDDDDEVGKLCFRVATDGAELDDECCATLVSRLESRRSSASAAADSEASDRCGSWWRWCGCWCWCMRWCCVVGDEKWTLAASFTFLAAGTALVALATACRVAVVVDLVADGASLMMPRTSLVATATDGGSF